MMKAVDFEIVIGVVFVMLAIWLVIRHLNSNDKHELEDHMKNKELKKGKHKNPHV